VSGEAYISNLSRFTRLHERGVGSFFVEDAVRVFEANDFVMLDEVYVIYF
jgi:hypothetical protein